MKWYRPPVVVALALAIGTIIEGTTVNGQTAPGDVTLKRTSPESPSELPRVTFPHWRHRLFFTCNVCHPAIFPMKADETTVTMDDLKDGKLCSVCHNGKIAWGVSVSTCTRCHAQ